MNLWLLLVVMALATYRLTRFAVADTFPPVLWARDRLAGGWRPMTDEERAQDWDASQMEFIDGVASRYVRRAPWSPFWLAELVSCAWCASGWVAAGVTVGTWWWVGLPMPVLVWLAVWAVGGMIAAQEWA
jgi:hypothetical protein